jgi:hypothetical protein
MAAKTDYTAIDDRLEALFTGELGSLEGEQEAVELWDFLQANPAARTRYEAMVVGLRAFAGKTGPLSFHDAEADALWPVLMGHVAADAHRRSGLSKRALQHLAVPDILASITRAVTNFSEKKPEGMESLVTAGAVRASEDQDVKFSLTRVGGEVAFRLYSSENAGGDAQNGALDMRVKVDGNEVKSNVTTEDWAGVTSALGELSRVTEALLGEDVLVNGRISIRDGRAEVFLNPLDVRSGNKS